MLVIFEGLDIMAKTALVKMIKKYCTGLNITVKISKEFETNIGNELKQIAKVKNVYLSIINENNLIRVNGMQPIEYIFDEAISNIKEYKKRYEKRYRNRI